MEGGGSSDKLFTNVRYYKVDWSKQISVAGVNAAAVLALTSDYIIIGAGSLYVGTKAATDDLGALFMEKPEAYIRVSDYKMLAGMGGTGVVYTDNFYDNQQTVAMHSSLGASYSREDLDAMLIPITEEEFYNLIK